MEIEAMKNLSIYHLVRFPAGYNTEAPNTVYPTILALYGHGNAKRSVCQKKTGRNYLFWKAAIMNTSTL